LKRDAKFTIGLDSHVAIPNSGNNGNLDTEGGATIFLVDFWKNDVIAKTNGKIAMGINIIDINAAEVTETRKNDLDDSIEKINHSLAAKSGFDSNDIAFSGLEAGNGLLSWSRHSFLGGDSGKLLHDFRKKLVFEAGGVDRQAADTAVDYHFFEFVSVVFFSSLFHRFRLPLYTSCKCGISCHPRSYNRSETLCRSSCRESKHCLLKENGS